MGSAIRTTNLWTLFRKMVKYNMKIIFGNRFIWFVLAAIAFYFFIAITSIYDGNQPDEGFIYGLQIMPGLLLIFYPMTFGIQNDLDAGILEILFGIPDYRYKVWLVRLILIFCTGWSDDAWLNCNELLPSGARKYRRGYVARNVPRLFPWVAGFSFFNDH